MFVIQKSAGIIPQVLTQILDSCVNGVTLADPDLPDGPIVYVNKAFESITGYPPEDIIGRNCRFLQGEDREQPERYKLRAAIDKHEPIEVTLRNYRKDGKLFYNKLNITPLFDNNGRVIYYLGVQYDVTEQVDAEAEIRKLGAKLSALGQA
jgi:PAS domain S-box-containing protein